MLVTAALACSLACAHLMSVWLAAAPLLNEALAVAASRALVCLFSFLKGWNSSQADWALPCPEAAPWCLFIPSGPYSSYSRLAVGSERTSAQQPQLVWLIFCPAPPCLACARSGADYCKADSCQGCCVQTAFVTGMIEHRIGTWQEVKTLARKSRPLKLTKQDMFCH